MASPAWRDERINRDKRLSDKRPIPGGISLDDFRTIQTYLAEMFPDIEAGTGQTGLTERAPYRLNESEKPWPLPIFVGWYEATGENVGSDEVQSSSSSPVAFWR